MERRHFIALAGGAAAWSVAARAQPAAKPVVGVLSLAATAFIGTYVPNVRDGMLESKYVEGDNFSFEYRGANGDYERLPALAADLVAQKVAVIFAAGGSDPAKAAKAASATIPIVFVSAADPLKAGLVASLNRPGGNVTGVSLIGTSLEPKRLEILAQFAPPGGPIGILLNPGYPQAEEQLHQLEGAAAVLGRRIEVERAGTDQEIESGLAALVRRGVQGLLVTQDQFFNSRSAQIVALAARYKLPGIYTERRYADDGGLVSYGPNFPEGYRQAGLYIGKILRGTKPADLPVLQPTSFELVINLKAAKALGIDVSPSLLARADQVIE